MKKTENSWWILAAEHVALTTLASLGVLSSNQEAERRQQWERERRSWVLLRESHASRTGGRDGRPHAELFCVASFVRFWRDSAVALPRQQPILCTCEMRRNPPAPHHMGWKQSHPTKLHLIFDRFQQKVRLGQDSVLEFFKNSLLK